MKQLKQHFSTLHTTISFDVLCKELYNKAWCVHQEPPTANSKTIQEYLGKYICRIGLSKQRFHYDAVHNQVTLTYKDYRKNQKPEDRPLLATKTMHPLTAIHHILQHCLPSYFQKCRYYGLHSSATYKKYQSKLPKTIKNNGNTVRTVMQIIKAMMGLQALQCTQCNHDDFEVQKVDAHRQWIQTWITIPTHNKDPVLYHRAYHQKHSSDNHRTDSPLLHETNISQFWQKTITSKL